MFQKIISLDFFSTWKTIQYSG